VLPALGLSPSNNGMTYQAVLQLKDNALYVSSLNANDAVQTASSYYSTSDGALSIPSVLASNVWYQLGLQLLTAEVPQFGVMQLGVLPTAQRTFSPSEQTINAVKVWVSAKNSNHLVFVSTAQGLSSINLTGETVQTIISEREIGAFDIRYRFTFDSNVVSLLAATDLSDHSVQFFTLDADTGNANLLNSIVVGNDLQGVCLYRSPTDNEHYVFTLEAQQLSKWHLNVSPMGIAPELVQQVALPDTALQCETDDEYGALYLHTANSVWRYAAEDLANQTPIALVSGDTAIQGLALYYTGYGTGYLLIAQGDNTVTGIRRRDNALLGNFMLVENLTKQIPEINHLGHIAVTGRELEDSLSGGLLVVQDEGNNSLQLVPWDEVAGFKNWVTDHDVDPDLYGLVGRLPSLVSPTMETEPVDTAGDAADDPAIWVHPTDPSLSLIIGTQKQGGLYTYDLSGRVVQYLKDGRLNNVDLRYNFPLGGESVALVAATNRTNNSIAFYRVNAETRQLEEVAARTFSAKVKEEVYGLCMYHSSKTDKYYVFINELGGLVQQWEVFDNGEGLVDASLVRIFEVGSQTEGCVVDDYARYLYISEEDVAIWRYPAEPNSSEKRSVIDYASNLGGHFTADAEGLAIYYINETEGYLIASSQGSNTYTVYNRVDNAFLGEFRIVADETRMLDGVTETDGIEVINQSLGAAFPFGAFITQDNSNTMPYLYQNFKVVPWEQIAQQLNLTINTEFQAH